MKTHLSKTRLFIPSTISLCRKGDVLIVNNMIRIAVPLPLEVKYCGGFLSLEATSRTTKKSKPLWGTVLAQIRNTLWGFHKGHFLKLKLVGVGYKANLRGNILVLRLGFNHRSYCTIPIGLGMEKIKKRPPTFCIRGQDYDLVQAIAHILRSIKKPEPYKGKGVVFLRENIQLKEGKKAKN